MIFRSDVFYSRTRYFVRFDLIKKKEIKGISSVRTRRRETPARFLKTSALRSRDSGNPALSSFYFFSSPPPL